MEERVTKRLSIPIGPEGSEQVEFSLLNQNAASSLSAKNVASITVSPNDVILAEDAETDEDGYSPEFLELAVPKLPQLERTNRARLLIQSPNKLHFYWSVGKNPYHTLNRALGEPANYTLVLKLIDLRADREEIYPVETEGNWWFDVDADAEYRAEIGFYAVNRPYIRVLYSNTVATPRNAPSPRTAEAAEWRVPAQKFARVLDVSGYKRDAFDVALAGDDPEASDIATRSAFAQFTGRRYDEFDGVGSSEIRYAMLALASGVPLSDLDGSISRRLFILLAAVLGVEDSAAEASARDRAMAALKDRFEFESEDLEIEEISEDAVFAGSLVHFPRKRRKGPRLNDVAGVSSHTGLMRPTS